MAKKVASCDYVAFVICEGEIFPGQIVPVQKSGCLIKSMVKSGFHRKWPNHEGILLYSFEDIKRKIADPDCVKLQNLQCLNLILFGELIKL